MSSASGSDRADDSSWRIAFDTFDPSDEKRREALLALGNGVLVTRAAAPEAVADDTHYPGTYHAGCYSPATSDIEGERVENETLVNLPNWLCLTFRIEGDDGRWFSLQDVDILDYRQELDLRRGLLRRRVLFRDARGRRTTLDERRLVSMAEPHLAALRVELTPADWSGRVEIRSALDGAVVNANVERYVADERRLLEILERGPTEESGGGGVLLKARTRRSHIEVTMAARTRLCGVDQGHVRREVVPTEAAVAEHLACPADPGATIGVEKVAAICTSLDPALSEPDEGACRYLGRAPGFDSLREAHERAWERLWSRYAIDTDRADVSRAVRLHAFHILQTVSPHSAALDVGVPARGWHGEGYRGHVFWDELFVLPFLTYRFPSLARSLVLYRYRRLDEARAAARRHGCRGAMFPWRSASSGREETPTYQWNPLSGHWMRDHTRLQRHVGAAVAFNVWQYFTVTGDIDFLSDYGAEMLLEIARFWASIAHLNRGLDRYEIRGVMGPDEYHTAYPTAQAPGIDNNTYTNLMAVWTLCRALEVLDHLPTSRREELWRWLRLSAEELAQWERISRRMRVVFHGDGILSQFEGFDRLRGLDSDALQERYGGAPVKWILEAEGESADAYQATKQADVLTLFYLLPDAQVIELLDRLGYRFDREGIARTADHYLQRTTHESSLSNVVYAGALAKVDGAASWRFFEAALKTDLDGEKGESTGEGIHLGAMAGTIDVLQRHYLGLRMQDGALHAEPAPPAELGRVRLSLQIRGNDIDVERSGPRLTIASGAANAAGLDVIHRDRRETLRPGASLALDL